MPQNIKITPASGLLEFIGNTLNPSNSDFKLTVNGQGIVSLSTSGASVNAYITGLGIDPAVLLGTANQIGLTYGGVNGQVTVGLPTAVIFPGTASIAATPVGANDIVNKAYSDANSNKRLTARAVATSNISLPVAPATVDGVTLANGDVVLVAGQTAQTDNGLYVFNGAGVAMTRSASFNTWTQVAGALITVSQGSSFANTFWMSTSPLTGTVGSTNITFKRVDSASGVPSNAGVVHTDGTVFTASLIVDADVHDIAWNKITGVPSNITTQTLQTVTQNGNTTNQNIVLLATGTPPAPASGGALYVDNTGSFGWVNASGFAVLFSSTISGSRTYSLPDASGTIVLTTGVQTVDRKTLTNTTVNTGTDATGDIYYRSSAGTLVALPIGTLGQVLGAGAGQPAWGNPSIDWSDVTGTPTTLAGYGITDPVLLRTGGVMTGSLILNSNPTTPFMAATKQYVDNLALGLDWKASVTASTAGTPLPPNTADGSFQTLTSNSNGAFPAVDGVTLAQGDTVLVMDEATAANNGAYTLTQQGTGSLPWILTRNPDSDTGPSLVSATYYIQNGTLFGSRVYTVNTPAPITLGTTGISFVQIAGANTYAPGAGLTLSGNVFSISNGGVTNAMIQNSSLNFALGSSGTTPAWAASNVVLGGTATLNVPNASATSTGFLTAADWVNFNSKLSATNAFIQGGNSFAAAAVLGTNDANDLTFIAHAVEIMRIAQSGGYVLIGSTTPTDTAKLQITGDLSIFGAINTIPQLKLQKAANQTFATPTILINDNTGTQIAAAFFDSTNQLITGTALVSGSSITGTKNTSLGYNALHNLTTGPLNVAVGYNAMIALTTGSGNTAIGGQAFPVLTIGNYNTAIGANAGQALVNGTNNVFIGMNVALSNTGSNNTIVGTQAGGNNTGSNNVFIGFQAGITTGSASNRLYISNSGSSTPLIYGEFDNLLATINGSLNVAAPTLGSNLATSAVNITQTWNTTGAPILIKANAAVFVPVAGMYLLSLQVNSTAVFSVDPSGNVVASGNGTFGGNIYLPRSTNSVGSIYKNNQLWISSYAGGSTQDNNIFVGYQSGNLINSGAGLNSALGYNTLKALVSGAENTAIGANALVALTTGNNNIALGSATLVKLTNGSNNIAIGEGVMSLAMVSGSNNTIIGTQAGLNSTGTGNVFLGFNAGQNELGSNLLYISNSAIPNPLIWGDFTNQIGRINGQLQVIGANNVDLVYIQAPVSRTNVSSIIKVVNSSAAELFRINGDSTNLFFGNSSGGSTWTGTSNVGIGGHTLQSLTTGASNMAIGLNALMNATTGSSNTAIGVQAMGTLTTGGANIAIGQSALLNLTGGNTNVAIGNQALFSVISGSNNVGIGFSAGQGNNGSGNVFIGYEAGNASIFNSVSNKLIIANTNTTTPLILGDFSAQILTVYGSQIINAPAFTTSNPASALSIEQTWNTTGQAVLFYANVTDTASASNSFLMEFQVNSTTPMWLDKLGNMYLTGAITADGLIAPVNTYKFIVWDTVTHTFGVVTSGGGGGTGFTTANNGLSSPASGVVQLGQNAAGLTGPAQLNSNIYIPLNGNGITLLTQTNNENITISANFIGMQSVSNSQIKLDLRTSATLTMVDEQSGAPTIIMSSNFGLIPGTVYIQQFLNNTRFQIVESTQATGFVYDVVNYRFGIKTLNPDHDFTVNGNIGQTFTVSGSANTHSIDAVTTWNTTAALTAYSFAVNVTASGGPSIIFQVVQDNIDRFAIIEGAGTMILAQYGIQLQGLGGIAGGISLNGSGPQNNQLIVSQGFRISQSNGLVVSNTDIVLIDTTQLQPTSGTGSLLLLGSATTFNPLSGTSVFNTLTLAPTINQQGGANGITRGLYINPTLTSAFDFRAIEVAAGSVLLATLALKVQVLSGAQTLTTQATNYVFNDTVTQTWTLPGAVVSGTMLYIKNRSTVNLTIATQGGQQIFDTVAVSTLTIQPGDAYIFMFDGTYWDAE